jgi:hypothetical protein
VIIALEGPDLSGKSTAAQQLMAVKSNAELLKKGPPVNGLTILEQYLKPLSDRADVLADNKITLVLDRWHIGELVYGPILRGKSLLSTRQADYIDMVLQSFGCHFYHVTAPLNILEDRYDIRGDGLIKREQLLTIWFEYQMQLTDRRSHWAMCTPSLLTEFLPRQDVVAPSPRAGQYIGPAKPKVLLLGDQRNDQRFIFPFVPELTSSGHWLMAAMCAAGVNHMDVGIMNACDVDPDVLLAQWMDLDNPPVVCLGNNAWRQWSIAHGADVNTISIKVNHPQWMRRFAYTAIESYGRTIKETMK